MDQSNYCVYVHIFPNGKQYVGRSSDVKKRWAGSGCRYRSNKIMKQDIKFYGWENIQHIILHRNLTLCEARKLEVKETIERKSYLPEYGYNLAIGEALKKERNPMFGKKGSLSPVAYVVYQYDMKTLKLIGKYESALQASLDNKIENHILECCYRQRLSCGGYYWSFDKLDYYNPPARKQNISLRKVIYQYDINMNFIQEFDSIKAAEETTHISNIGRACIQKHRTAGGYKWRYAHDYSGRHEATN